VNASNYDGRTALHLASSIGDVTLVATLLEAKADILPDAFGHTAWDDAARNQHERVIAALQNAAHTSHLLDSQLRQAVAKTPSGETAPEHGDARDHDLPAVLSRAPSNASSAGELAPLKHHHWQPESPG